MERKRREGKEGERRKERDGIGIGRGGEERSRKEVIGREEEGKEKGDSKGEQEAALFTVDVQSHWAR